MMMTYFSSKLPKGKDNNTLLAQGRVQSIKFNYSRMISYIKIYRKTVAASKNSYQTQEILSCYDQMKSEDMENLICKMLGVTHYIHTSCSTVMV